jgi:hypothetical protein
MEYKQLGTNLQQCKIKTFHWQSKQNKLDSSRLIFFISLKIISVCVLGGDGGTKVLELVCNLEWIQDKNIILQLETFCDSSINRSSFMCLPILIE